MKKAKSLLSLLLVLAPMLLAAGESFHFFDPRKLTRVQGTVQGIEYEDVYEKKSQFLVLTIASQEGTLYRVEVCPQWFFANDIAVGQKIHVSGSRLDEDAGSPYLIAQELSFRGERLVLRDRKGFPLWSRKGSAAERGNRKGPGGRGKG